MEPQSEMSRQFLATEATLFLSGSSDRKVQVMPDSDWLIPINTPFSLVQWSDQQQPHLTPPVKPPMRNTKVEVPRTPSISDTGPCHNPVTPVVRDTGRCQPPVTPVQTRASVTSLGTPDKASPGLHPDILAVLSWQNEQLAALQVSHHCVCYPRDQWNVYENKFHVHQRQAQTDQTDHLTIFLPYPAPNLTLS